MAGLAHRAHTGLLGYRGHLLRLELICLGYVVCDWPEMSTGATDLCEALTVAPRARHGGLHTSMVP